MKIFSVTDRCRRDAQLKAFVKKYTATRRPMSLSDVNPKRLALGVGLAVLWTATASGQLANADRAAIDAYQAALAAVASRPPGRGIEPALKALQAVEAALMRSRDGDVVLESLSDEEFTRVNAIEGMVVNREEVLFVRPDVEYFRGLARARGDAADRAFFAALKATYPDSVWKDYVEQQTDVGGCIRFGTMTLVETYVRWADFQRAYPNRYADFAKKESDDVFKALVESQCSCDDLASVEKELDEFLRRVRTPAPRAAVEARTQAVRTGRSGIQTSCVGGR